MVIDPLPNWALLAAACSKGGVNTGDASSSLPLYSHPYSW